MFAIIDGSLNYGRLETLYIVLVPSLKTKFSRLKERLACFKHSDWLLKNFQPIRMLKTNFTRGFFLRIGP